MSGTTFHNIRPGDVPTVADDAERLALIPSSDGYIVVQLDTDAIWIWNQSSNIWVGDSNAIITPASPENSIQFNNYESFGGSSQLLWDPSHDALQVNTIEDLNGSISIDVLNRNLISVDGNIVTDYGSTPFDPFSIQGSTYGLNLNVDDINNSSSIFSSTSSMSAITFTPGPGSTNINDLSVGGLFTGSSTATFTVTITNINEMTIGYSIPTTFVIGDTIIGLSSGATGILVLDTGTDFRIDLSIGSPAFLPGETIQDTGNSATTVADTVGGPADIYSWSDSSSGGGGGLLITSGTIPLDNGITITFGQVDGHSVNDTWTWIYTLTSTRGLLVDFLNNNYKIGDVDAAYNGTAIQADVTNNLLSLVGGSLIFNGLCTFYNTHRLSSSGLPSILDSNLFTGNTGPESFTSVKLPEGLYIISEYLTISSPASSGNLTVRENHTDLYGANTSTMSIYSAMVTGSLMNAGSNTKTVYLKGSDAVIFSITEASIMGSYSYDFYYSIQKL